MTNPELRTAVTNLYAKIYGIAFDRSAVDSNAELTEYLVDEFGRVDLRKSEQLEDIYHWLNRYAEDIVEPDLSTCTEAAKTVDVTVEQEIKPAMTAQERLDELKSETVEIWTELYQTPFNPQALRFLMSNATGKSDWLDFRTAPAWQQAKAFLTQRREELVARKSSRNNSIIKGDCRVGDIIKIDRERYEVIYVSNSSDALVIYQVSKQRRLELTYQTFTRFSAAYVY